MALELEPIVFASKQEVSDSKITSSMLQISSEEIENTNSLKAADLLQGITGVYVEQQGVGGGLSNVYIRGADSKHTVIMIDGVKVFDPTSIGGKMNLSILNSLDIEKVEVLKGSQSVLHGSDAIGGVINFVTKKGSETNSISIGSGITENFSSSHTVGFDNTLVHIASHYQESKIDSDVSDTEEKDFKSNKGLSISIGHELNKLNFETILKITDEFSEVDAADSNGLPVDSDISYQKQRHFFLKESVTYLTQNTDKLIFDFGFSRYERTNKSSYGLYNYDGAVADFEGRYLKKIKTGSVLIGLNQNLKTYRDDSTVKQEVSTQSVFYNQNYVYTNHIFEFGSRLVSNKDFGSHMVYNLGWKFKTSEFSTYRASIKTGYKAPTVYELLGPDSQYGPVGNKELSPEKSVSTEVGYDYHRDHFIFGSSFFYSEISQSISFVNSKGYVNIDGFITRGAEAFVSREFKPYKASISLSKTDYSLSNGLKAQKKPYESATFKLEYKYSDSHLFAMNVLYNSRRYEYTNNQTKKNTLKAYEVVDLKYIYSKKSLRVMTTIKNIFNRDYETSMNYSTQGLGAQLNLQYLY